MATRSESRHRPASSIDGELPAPVLVRAVFVVVGLTMLVVVNVSGPGVYGAWALIALALVSELAATFVYWRRGRRRTR